MDAQNFSQAVEILSACAVAQIIIIAIVFFIDKGLRALEWLDDFLLEDEIQDAARRLNESEIDS